MSDTNFLKDLLRRRSELETLIRQKVDRFNTVSAQQDQLQKDILDTNGKLSMVNELLSENARKTTENSKATEEAPSNTEVKEIPKKETTSN